MPMFDFPSIHLNGTKDSFYAQCQCAALFLESANPRVVEFEDGHRFPRCIPDEGFTVLKEFVKE